MTPTKDVAPYVTGAGPRSISTRSTSRRNDVWFTHGCTLLVAALEGPHVSAAPFLRACAVVSAGPRPGRPGHRNALRPGPARQGPDCPPSPPTIPPSAQPTSNPHSLR